MVFLSWAHVIMGLRVVLSWTHVIMGLREELSFYYPFSSTGLWEGKWRVWEALEIDSRGECGPLLEASGKGELTPGPPAVHVGHRCLNVKVDQMQGVSEGFYQRGSVFAVHTQLFV